MIKARVTAKSGSTVGGGEVTRWVRDGAPRYNRQLSRGRVATATKVRRPIVFCWEIKVTTVRGDYYLVCRADTFTAAKRLFEDCAKTGVTQFGQPFTI